MSTKLKVLFDAIPTVDRNGNSWSDEQQAVLNDFADAIYEHQNGGDPISIAVQAVAGSGKTSLLQGMTHIVAKLAPALLTAMTAFNRHIALGSKDILTEFKSTDGLNIKIFGGRNTVNAGGHSMLMNRSNGAGFDRVVLSGRGDDRYVRIARLTLAGWLGRDVMSFEEGTGSIDDRKLLLEVAKSAMEVRTTSHAFNDMIGDLVKACQIVMDEGFIPSSTVRQEGVQFGSSKDGVPYIPPTVNVDDVKEVASIIERVGANQNWNDNTARNLGDMNVCYLVVEILSVAIETAFEKIELKPYCGKGKSFMDAVVPNKNQRGWWEEAKPMKQLIRTTDPAMIKSAQFAILETGGCRFPPASKGSKSGVKAKSFATDKKAIVREYDGETIMSFENKGHLKKIGGKAIGSQFGKNGNHKVDGEFISSWRMFKNGVSVIKPNCVGKVISFLSSTFGDEFENQLGDDSDVEVVTVSGGKGELVLSMKDQIYLPHALDLQIPDHEKADVIFIDEVQDLSTLKAQLVWRLVKEDAHKVIVGDLRQAIYLFAGASSKAFEDNAESIGATFYPQTICWRGTAMVAASARYACEQFSNEVRKAYKPFLNGEELELPDYQAHRSPLEAGYDWSVGALPVQVKTEEVVEAYRKSVELHGEDTTFGMLCRIKKPLAGFIKAFLKNGIPVSTPSDEDGGLVKEAFSLAKKNRSDALDDKSKQGAAKSVLGLGWHKITTSRISSLKRDIESMVNVAVGKYSDMFKGDRKSMAQDTAFQEVMGNLELLTAFVELYAKENGNDVSATGKESVVSVIENWVENSLFSERGGNAVHIATIHRYKGDEANVMFVVNSYMDKVDYDDEEGGNASKPCFMSERSVQASVESAINEVNMAYVAFTRAQKQNIIVNASIPFENDVGTRLTGAFERDEDKMWGQGDLVVQDPKESDSEDISHSIICPDCSVSLLKEEGGFPLHSHYCGLTDEEKRRITARVNTPDPSDDVDDDIDRCVECSTIITEDEEHGVCCQCQGKLCRDRLPTHSKSGKFKKHMGGSINEYRSCGSTLANITLEEMMNNSHEELESKRICKHCEYRNKLGVARREYLESHDIEPEIQAEDEDCDDQECVLIERLDGSTQRISMEDFDQLETENPNFDGIKRASHLSEDEVQGVYFERIELAKQRQDLNKLFKIKSLPNNNGSFAIEKQEVHEFILQYNGEEVMHCRHFRGQFKEYMEFDVDIFEERNFHFGTGMDDRTMGDFGMTTSQNGLGNSCPKEAKVRMDVGNAWEREMGFVYDNHYHAVPRLHQIAIHVFSQFVRVGYGFDVNERHVAIDGMATDYLLGGNA